jgi:chromosomal replication initiation ATPase DnaA
VLLNLPEYSACRRDRDFVTCRHVFGRIALDNVSNATLKKIGEFLGGRDHSTIINGNTRVRNLNQFDKKFNRKYTKLLSFIEKRI